MRQSNHDNIFNFNQSNALVIEVKTYLSFYLFTIKR